MNRSEYAANMGLTQAARTIKVRSSQVRRNVRMPMWQRMLNRLLRQRF